MGVVHELTVSDLSAGHIQAVLALSKRLEEDALPCSFWALDEKGLSRLMQAENKDTVVALINSQVVGIGVLSQGELYQRHMAELSVAICPHHRRKGVAHKIITSLEEQALKRGVELLKGLVQTENLGSRRLVESMGYEHRATLYGEFKSARFGEIDDYVYYKRLVPRR